MLQKCSSTNGKLLSTLKPHACHKPLFRLNFFLLCCGGVVAARIWPTIVLLRSQLPPGQNVTLAATQKRNAHKPNQAEEPPATLSFQSPSL
ncbi:hypothetical protein FN846DRAFT_980716, partial [Sphaerosporella brunnea]